jgi:CRISPR-associated endonuclease/helicase Cas3
MTPLLPGDFSAFFHEVWGHAPFPWQARLAAEVLAAGWPSVLDLPTGVGKTAALDIALFTLAAMPERLPRRIALVVDRRTIVDQSASRARALQAALGRAEAQPVGAPTTARVAAALRALAGPALRDAEPVIDVAVLRGGLPREADWARTPSRPAVLLSTVDQVGSRLLFRGYGVSDSMKPVHAGLLGHDLLLLLDEVHLAQPLCTTLDALAPARVAGPLPARWAHVQMSATVAPGDAPRFTLAAEDHAHPVLARRLQARKPAQLGEPVKAAMLPARLAEEARAQATAGRAVLVVVNRVADAVEVHRLLLADKKRPGTRLHPSSTGLPAGPGLHVGLVTGRMRAHERDTLGAWLSRHLAPGRPRPADGPACVVVATQCIEAGADLDFDALVTECASLDALRQRAGRVDRVGALGDAPVIVIPRQESLDASKGDPIYGGAIAFAWDWLRAQTDAARDLGPAGPRLPAEPAARPPQPLPPVLLPAHLDAWVQTAPRPEPEPEPAHFLHGLQDPQPEVRLIWRADLGPDLLAHFAEDPASAEAWLAAAPPQAGEPLALPLWVARAFLAGRPAPDPSADIEGAPSPADDRASDSADDGAPVALRAAGAGGVAAVGPGDLQAGDLLVLPAARGGLIDGTFDPAHPGPAPEAHAPVAADGSLCVRLHPAVWPALPPPPRPAALAEDDAPSPSALVGAWLDALPPNHPLAERRVRAALRRARRVRVGPPGDEHWVLVGSAPATSDADDGSFVGGRPVPLGAHLRGVGDLAAAFATAAGLSPALVEDLALAGRLHDLGKADPRFQLLLHGGDEVRAAAAVPGSVEALLAKSGGAAADLGARRRAQAQAGYPAGARHELLSVALAASAPALLAAAHDPALVLHLVASHHGHCRPLAPLAPDASPREVALEWEGHALRASTDHGLEAIGSGVATRFWSLTRRYGPHGLAFLEAVLRLADHRRSELEQAARGADLVPSSAAPAAAPESF